MDPAALEGVAALRSRLVAFPTRLGDRTALGDWVAQLSDTEVCVIARRAEGKTLTSIAIDLAITVDEVEAVWGKLKEEWAVLD